MLPYIISNAIVSFVSLIQGVFVLIKNRKELINRIWFLFSLAIVVWTFSSIKTVSASDESTALFWGRFLYVGAVFIPSLFLHFTESLLDKQNKRKIVILIGYLLSLIFLLLNCTDLFIKGVIPKPPFNFYDVPGITYPGFILFFIVYIIFAHVDLIKTYKTSVGSKQNQIKYLLFASILGFGGGASSIPLVFVNNPLFYFTYPLLAAYPLIVSYAIVKHRLMDIDFVIRKGAAYVYASFLLLIPLFTVVIGAQSFIFKDINLPFSVLLLVIISISAYIFPRIRIHAEKTVEQYIFRDKFDYKKTISDLSKAMVSILNIAELCKKIITNTTEALDINKASVFIFDEEKDAFLMCDSRGLNGVNAASRYRRDDPFFKALEKQKEIIIREELERYKDNTDARMMARMLNIMESEVCIPLIAKQKLIGIINLGMKGNKKMYTHEDLEMLTTLANSATVGIENAQLYENLKKTKKVMIRADRLAGIGTLAAGIAHEIRNPLVAIKTSAQLLPERFDDEEFRNYFSTVVASEIDKISLRINELLEYSRPSGPFFQQENLNDILNKMVSFIKNEAYKKDLTLETMLSNDLPTVTVDKEQMKQVFLNLLLNAIQSTPEKGKIFITTRNRLITNGDPAYVQVEISDTGVGIPEEDLDKIFTPFFTTKATGSGLGLAITHQIIEEHEGTIDVQSAINRGTSFTINLPVNPLILKQNKNDARNFH